MAITNSNMITAGWSGAIGKQVVFRQIGGKTYTSAYPDMSERVLSAKQKKVNETMKLANAYAQNVLADTEKKNAAQLRLDVPSTKLYTALVKEYFENNYKKEVEVLPAADTAAAIEPAELSDAAKKFIIYLLTTTDKTATEIATMVDVSEEAVENLKKDESLRKL